MHLTPNPGENNNAIRKQEIKEILSILSEKQYFIVFGDFNAQSTDLYKNFTNAGYNIARAK